MSAEPGAASGPPRRTRRGKAIDLFRLMADCAPLMIWRAGPDRGCVYVNARWREFTGQLRDEALGRGRLDALHADDRPAFLAILERAYAARAPFEARYRVQRSDGEYRWVFDQGVPLMRDGELSGFAGWCVDTTDRLDAEAAARGRFLALASHELRSPLNGIKSWAYVLQDQLGDASPPVRRALAGILNGVEDQVRLIEGLLDVTRAVDLDEPLAFRPIEQTCRGDPPAPIDPKGARMKSDDRKSEIKAENERTSRMPKERPERGPEPDTLEGPGDRQEAKGESDAVNKTTRRGER